MGLRWIIGLGSKDFILFFFHRLGEIGSTGEWIRDLEFEVGVGWGYEEEEVFSDGGEDGFG